MERIVFVFGAGASKDEELPLQDKLLLTYFQSKLDDSLRGDLEQYFKDFFNIDFRNLDNAQFPTFEEALGILELAIQKDEIYSPNYSLERLRKLRDYLILSMGIAIENSPLNENNSHDRLIRRLFRKGHFNQGEYSFISFNYDILLDKALMNALSKNIYVDYGIEFTNENPQYAQYPFDKWDSPKNKQNVTFLKLHGSFNWMCCPKCNSIYITGDKKSGFFKTGYLHKIEHCLKDESALNCVIEPPSYFKKYQNIYIQNIWKKAFDVFSDADKIIFLGYSLPEADIQFKYLLKRSCFNTRKKIIVINPSPEDKLKSKYERLLGKVNYQSIKLIDFVNNHLKYLN